MAWYREWFGDEYLELYANRNEHEAEAHIDFVERALGGDPGKLRPKAVLDLACGAGRHTAALRRRGYRVLGVDLSVTLLIRGQVPSVAGDMRRLPFADGSFTWVLNFFTSFGYFESERENFLVLGEIARLLPPGGRFLIDLMNPPFALANLNPREVQDVEGRRVEIDRWYDAASQRLNKRIRVVPNQGPARTYLESVRAYQPEEVTVGLHWVGLALDQLYGSFRGEPYDRDSERLILVGKKPD